METRDDLEDLLVRLGLMLGQLQRDDQSAAFRELLASDAEGRDSVWRYTKAAARPADGAADRSRERIGLRWISPGSALPMCRACWERHYPDRVPVRVPELEIRVEECAWCGAITTSGLYGRVDPQTARAPCPKPEAETT